eukprot:jgi/Psemu1/69569/estExt_Genemark1.C_9200004
MVLGDKFDDAISTKVKNLAIRGASIAYYDMNKMSTPVTRGFGQVSSDSSSASVTPNTTFMLASISKPFTASAVAVLVDKGIISSIDEDICNVLPADYPKQMCRNPKYPNAKVTWRMLITHRSSMKNNIPGAKNSQGKSVSPSYGPSGGYVSDSPAAGNPTCPLEGVVGFYRALLIESSDATTDVGAGVILQGGKALNWYDLAKSKGGMWTGSKPGKRVVYSNSAYGLIAALVELASGQPFPEFCHQNLFDPVGMSHTAWFRRDLPVGTLEAVPVEKQQNGGFRDVGHYCFIDYASGQLRTSANDLALWSSAMMGYGAPTLWSQTMGKEVVKCQERNVKNKPIRKQKCEYGYGWILLNNSMKKTTKEKWLKQGFQQYDWTDGIWHNGAEAGSQTNIIILPMAGVFVAVLTNTDFNSETAAQQLTKAVVEAPLPLSSPTATPQSKPTFAPQVKPSSAPQSNPTIAPQVKPSSAPQPKPTPPPTENDGKCPGKAEFVFSITTDEFPKETKWVLKRNNQAIEKRRYNTYKKPFFTSKESFCVPLTGNYYFRIEDRYGDGICCNKGNGSYEISFDGDVKRQGGNFEITEITTWSA